MFLYFGREIDTQPYGGCLNLLVLFITTTYLHFGLLGMKLKYEEYVQLHRLEFIYSLMGLHRPFSANM
jgi:hypothetical protein